VQEVILYFQPKNFSDFCRLLDTEFPASFEGCIAVFCKPQTWFVYGFEDMSVKSGQFDKLNRTRNLQT
jgi:hypothetical protein